MEFKNKSSVAVSQRPEIQDILTANIVPIDIFALGRTFRLSGLYQSHRIPLSKYSKPSDCLGFSFESYSRISPLQCGSPQNTTGKSEGSGMTSHETICQHRLILQIVGLILRTDAFSFAQYGLCPCKIHLQNALAECASDSAPVNTCSSQLLIN